MKIQEPESRWMKVEAIFFSTLLIYPIVRFLHWLLA